MLNTKYAWLRGLDSNQDNQIQSLVCYQLHYPGVVETKPLAFCAVEKRANGSLTFHLRASDYPSPRGASAFGRRPLHQALRKFVLSKTRRALGSTDSSTTTSLTGKGTTRASPVFVWPPKRTLQKNKKATKGRSTSSGAANKRSYSPDFSNCRPCTPSRPALRPQSAPSCH